MKEIKLTKGYVALVDDEDYEKVNSIKWHINKGKKTVYAHHMENILNGRKYVGMHRLIMNTPDGLDVDHIDGNGLNNQKYNLRNCTRSENLWNSKPKNGKKYKGTRFSIIRRTYINKHGVEKKYTSFTYNCNIRYKGKLIVLGNWGTEEEAALMYNISAKLLFGKYAKLNYIEYENWLDLTWNKKIFKILNNFIKHNIKQI